jgi:enhancer of polycomb-like protein
MCSSTAARSREKVNRPQTRRRRDNSDELMEKLRQMRDNLMGAKQILEEVVRRERRKRDLAVRGQLGQLGYNAMLK